MNFEVVTTMNLKYYNEIGHRMLDSFQDQWPCHLNLYWENIDELPEITHDKISILDLFLKEPECESFVNRHRNRSDQTNPKELHLGAVRFAYKTFSIIHATTHSKSRYVIWLDADTFTHTKITEEILFQFVKEGCYVSYLGRDNNYSECGFVVYDTHHPMHTSFIQTWRNLYEKDEVFKLPQWHDSFVFDCIRREYEKHGMKNNNFSPWGKDYDHVFVESELGKYIDHMKGPRKEQGRTPKNESNHDHEYWN